MNTAALIRLWNCTQLHPDTSGGRACAAVLLGLYNGDRFPLDLTELRALDCPLREAALAVITCDATRCQREVHSWLNYLTGRDDFGARFEHLAHYWAKPKGCAKKHLDPISPRWLAITPAAPATAAAPALAAEAA